MLGKQNDGVDEVVVSDLVDLELGQQKIREADCWKVKVEPAVEMNGVRHDELIHEHVDLNVRLRMLIDQTLHECMWW